MTPQGRSTLGAVAGAAATAAGVLLVPLLVGRYFGRDLTLLEVPLYCALEDALSRHDVLTSPLLGQGSPFFARPEAALLHPLRWAFTPFSPELAASLFAATHLVIAAASTAFLLRVLGARALAAYAAGVAFGLAGTCLDLMEHSVYVVGAAFLPLAWAGARLAAARRSLAGAAMLGTAVGLLLVGGDVHTAAIASGLALVVAGDLALRRRREGTRAAVVVFVPVALGLAAGFLVGGSALFPMLAEAALSRRGGGLDHAELTVWSFAPREWAGLVWPGATRILEKAGAQLPWNQNPYVGLVALVAAALGAHRRRARAAAVLATAALLLAVGDATPFFRAAEVLVPPVSWFRFPAKYLLLFTLAVVVIAALELDRRARPAAPLHGLARAAGFVFTLHGAGLLFALRFSESGLFLAGLQGSVGLFLLVIILARPTWRAAFPLVMALEVGLAAVAAVEAGPSLLAIEGPLAPLARPSPPLFDARDPSRVPSVCVDPAVEVAIRSLPPRERYARALAEHVGGIGEATSCQGLTGGVAYSPIQARVPAHLYGGLYGPLSDDFDPARLASLLGCDFLVTAREVGPAFAAVDVPPPDPDVTLPPGFRLYRARHPLPAVFAPRPRVVSDEDAVFAWTTDPPDRAGAIPVDVPEGLPGGEAAHRALSKLDDDARFAVTYVEAASSSEVQVLLAEPPPTDEAAASSAEGAAEARPRLGVLAVRRPFAAGWQAEQGGEPLPVVRVGGVFVGAVVDAARPGPVVFRYALPRLGLAVASGSSGAALLVTLVALAARRRRAARAQQAAKSLKGAAHRSLGG